MTVVRRATPDDARRIAEVHVETWQATYVDILPKDVLDTLDVDAREGMWRTFAEHDRLAVFVAEREGRLVGFVNVGASRDLEGIGELYAIYVAPAVWGTGAGLALMNAGVDWLKQRHTEAVLWVAEQNTRARRFYERYGWVIDATRVDLIEGVEVPETRYRLSGLDRL